MLQPVCRPATPAHPLLTPRGRASGHAGTPSRARVAASPARARRLMWSARACCVGDGGGSGETTEPVQAEEAVAEELESLEEAAIAGEDEGRRPTDYDRRAHIFEESSRVFRELKQRRDGDGDGDDREGGVHGGAAAAETATREPQQKLG
ncbi:hypothetical protein QOZ80_3AG0247060 [Eleusine coracana subsp. coracana]|nr:hypothetical protein QOZ80_3AG0247060 [Eleusine coracana subsp. coracana]